MSWKILPLVAQAACLVPLLGSLSPSRLRRRAEISRILAEEDLPRVETWQWSQP
jgi:hypothetical protein